MRFTLQIVARCALLALFVAPTVHAIEPAGASSETIAAPDESRLQAQRALFKQTRELLRKGNVAAAAPGMASLIDYPLYPYLELQRLTIGLDRRSIEDDSVNDAAATGNPAVTDTVVAADLDATGVDTTGVPAAPAAAEATGNTEIDTFLRRYAGSLVAEQLRKSWLAILARDSRWREYRNYYSAEGFTATKLQQCWNLEALHRTGQAAAALQQTSTLWLETDLPDACDEPFARWLDSDQRNEALVWQRLLLALDRKQETLARFLAVNIREPYKLSAEYALLLYRDPTALENMLPQLNGRMEAGSVIALTLKNLAKRDADIATAVWQPLRAGGQLSAEQNSTVRTDIGRQQIVQHGSDALPWLLQYDAAGEDSFLLEARVRLALPGGDWPRIAQWIEQMPQTMLQTPRWSYWHARALAAQDDAHQQQRATTLFQEVAKDRSYYGFRAADQLKIAYQLNDQPLPGRAIKQTAHAPALLRAREFHALGETTNGRREWLFALRDMTMEQQQNAALLAEQWGWHDRAIQTASKAQAWNDLQLRFPLAYRDLMQRASHDTALSLPWLFAIARQESTFMPDARSPVGALGLMQLMPDTAKQVARGLKIKVNSSDLQQPAPNIRLGSTYLSNMLSRYSGNRILATAAYNAGPGRISRLVKNQQGTLPSDVWVETLPYKETREYVQNVLAFAVIYAQRLGLHKPLIERNEAIITGTAQLSENN